MRTGAGRAAQRKGTVHVRLLLFLLWSGSQRAAGKRPRDRNYPVDFKKTS
ncbi:hypothetical protein CSB95_1856 [Pseudomonas aeruginosa]|nr:Hypothetical protein SCV20265_5651 [Pseudomonas aeruginosa SCV20265]ARI04716.1 hypothetical protein Y880_04961 [Pseudomonas aeruginosa PAK]AWE84791.1 hypothetical protein CSC29_5434 [Pseudomonas aeruginosa]SMZ53800.1 hypothetical protein PANN_59630 [Pseudomonas aeruginosa C-NN2]GAJ53542.1 hypothetical protein RBRAMI_2425 [Pseudomonas aeruginosa RB]